MSPIEEIRAQKILTILRYDIEGLYNRLIYRDREYTAIFAMKRTRDHFPMLFQSRFPTFTADDLCSLELEGIDLVYEFYNLVERLYWYLMQTEDMPQTVEDRVQTNLRKIKKLYPQVMENLNKSSDDVPELPLPDTLE